jgi:hypothetical protein
MSGVNESRQKAGFSLSPLFSLVMVFCLEKKSFLIDGAFSE